MNHAHPRVRTVGRSVARPAVLAFAALAFAVLVPTVAHAQSTASPVDVATFAAAAEGRILFVRHALATGDDDPTRFDLTDCATQRNLDPRGRVQANALGAALRTAGVTPDRVLASEYCRARDTARLLGLGPVTTFSGLNRTFGATRSFGLDRLAETIDHVGADETVVMVTHSDTIRAWTGVDVPSGGMLAFDPATRTAQAVLPRDPAAAAIREVVPWLYVHAGGRVALEDPRTLVATFDRDVFGFTEAPYRRHETLDAEAYVGRWDGGPESFGADPPNAVLTWFGDDVHERWVVLTDAERTTTDDGRPAIRYALADPLDGAPSGRFSLFVDYYGMAGAGGMSGMYGMQPMGGMSAMQGTSGTVGANGNAGGGGSSGGDGASGGGFYGMGGMGSMSGMYGGGGMSGMYGMEPMTGMSSPGYGMDPMGGDGGTSDMYDMYEMYR